MRSPTTKVRSWRLVWRGWASHFDIKRGHPWKFARSPQGEKVSGGSCGEIMGSGARGGSGMCGVGDHIRGPPIIGIFIPSFGGGMGLSGRETHATGENTEEKK